MFINNDVTNFGGLPAGGSGTLAQRPAAGLLGRIYIATDTLELYRDTGTVWTTIGGPGSGTVTGTGTVNEITFWNGAGSIGSLTTAIYPSLTELSYVKGVTSGIQTQINGKQDAIILTTSGTGGAATFIGNTLNVPQYQATLTNPVTGTGVSGQAAFWTGTNLISGDNAFHWDNVNKRLGINTVNPGARLDIHGTGVIAQLNGTGTNDAYLDFQNAGSVQWRIGNFYNGAAQTLIINNSAGTQLLSLSQLGAAVLSGSFAASSINITASNGIAAGISNNSATFETVRITNNGSGNLIDFRNTGGTVASFSNNGALTIGYTSTPPTSGLIVLGLVGIGTASPQNTLHVVNGSSLFENSSVNTTAFATAQAQLINTGAATTNQRVDLILRFQDGTYNGTGGVSMVRESNIARSSSLVLSGINSSGNGTETVRITSGGDVGIGQLIPGYKLDVNGTFQATGSFSNMYTGNIFNTNTTAGTSYGLFIRGGTNSTDAALNVNNAANSVTLFRIAGNGNVGIDYNPNVKLAVNGSIYQGSNTANALYDMLCNGNLYTGGITPTILTVTTTPYTIARTATGYKCDSGASVLDLPSASGLNNLFFIINNSGGNLTVNRNGSDTILNLSGTAVTSLTISNNQRALIYMGGGTQSYLIFQA